MPGKKASTKSNETSDSTREVFEEFFNDYYKRRRQVYYLNFIRGIWFGLGSVIGGTLVLAGIIWLLSLFQHIPFLTDIIENIQRSIQDARP